jgi:hypothetical protein
VHMAPVQGFGRDPHVPGGHLNHGGAAGGDFLPAFLARHGLQPQRLGPLGGRIRRALFDVVDPQGCSKMPLDGRARQSSARRSTPTMSVVPSGAQRTDAPYPSWAIIRFMGLLPHPWHFRAALVDPPESDLAVDNGFMRPKK